MSQFPGLPAWIAYLDGRREPFTAESIFQRLFRASTRLGHPDTFRAQELADAVLHFLAESDPGEVVGIDAIRDVTVKVIRELGQVSLAAALAEIPMRPEDGDARVPEIAFAEHNGLLTRGDIDAPIKLAGSVLTPRPPEASAGGPGMTYAVQAAGAHTGHYVAIDGPEFLFSDVNSPESTRDWWRALNDGLRRSGLRAVVNLNCRMPPAWAVGPTGGLFPNDVQERLERRREGTCDAILDQIAIDRPAGIRIDWHLSDSDFQPEQRERLLRVCERVREGVYVALVMDRPRRPVALAEGLDREHPATFDVIGVRVDALARHLEGNGRRGKDALMQALPSLASLARSAGNARLRFLRDRAGPDVAQGFLLDRARLLVSTVGGNGSDDAAALQQVRRAILGGLSRFPSLGPPSILDTPPPWSDFGDWAAEPPDDPPRTQLSRAAALHADTGTGTAMIRLSADVINDVSNLADLIAFAFRQPGLVRVQFRP